MHGLVGKAGSGSKGLTPDFSIPGGPIRSEGSADSTLNESGEPRKKPVTAGPGWGVGVGIGGEAAAAPLHAMHSGPSTWYQPRALVRNV